MHEAVSSPTILCDVMREIIIHPKLATMHYVQQHPELIPTMVLSALAHLHRKTGEEIDQVFFDDISHSDPLIELINWQQAFDLGQDPESTLEEDILIDHRGDFGAKETHWWLDFTLSGGKRPLILRRCHRPRDSGM